MRIINVLLVGIYRGAGAIGGVTNYNNLLLKHIDGDRFRVEYFSLGKSPNWYVGPNPPSLLGYYLGHIGKIIGFARRIKRSRIDIVHLEPTFSRTDLFRLGIFSLAAKALGAQTLLNIRGWKEWEYEKIKCSWFLSRVVGALLRSQDMIVVLSPSLKDRLRELSDGLRILTTTTMVETDLYASARKTFEPPFRLLFVGSLFRKKGIFELVEAMSIVTKKKHDVRLTVMGTGDNINTLREIAKRAGLSRTISFLGRQEGTEKFEVYRESDIFVLPSYTEGFPNVFCEALASGLTYIGTRVGGLVHAFENGRQGLVIESNPPEPEEIAERIIQLIEDPKLMGQMSEENRREARERYDCRVVSNGIGTIYEEIIGLENRRP